MAQETRGAVSTTDAPDGESARRRAWVPPATFALLALLIHIDVLFNGARVPAAPGSDLSFQFLAWRHFGFGELAAGNLPLWNPHIFGGTPYLASFQSALFYPPNWLHLLLPLGLAISWNYALHTFLMGWTMSLWARYRGVGTAGQILAGLMMMLGGPFFLHGFAGHLPHLGAMVWAPLIFLATDALAEGKGWRWIVLGGGALALQILAGHPQYTFYTGLMVGAYALLRVRRANLRRLLPGLAVIYLLGAALAAVQLFPGLEAAGENIRTSGLPYAMASEFSLAPVQGLTALGPFIFGHHAALPLGGRSYLGPGYLWETCLFLSLTGLALAGLGVSGLRREHKVATLAMVLLTGLLAMGRHTPLHPLLYRGLPFFDSFRAPAKFAFFTALFVALAAAEGVQTVLRGDRARARTRLARVLLLGFALLLALASLTRLAPARVVPMVSAWLAKAGDHFVLGGSDYARPEVGAMLQRTLAGSLLVAAATMLAGGVLLRWGKRASTTALSLVGLASLELLVFAVCARASMPSELPYPEAYAKAIAAHEPYRTLHPGTTTNLGLLNAAMARGTYEMWGYDPGLLRRYGQLMAASQDVDPDRATQILRFTNPARMDGLYRMFRLKWLCLSKPEMHVQVQPRPLGQVELVGRAEVVGDRAAMFAKLLDPSFDPKAVVYLDQAPAIMPAGAPVEGEAQVVGQDSDTLEIRARTDRPAVLLVTDNYAKGWRAQAMPDSAQREYQVLPANHTLRAVPLAAGTHHLRMVYRPSGWLIGRWVSLATLLGVLAALWLARSSRRRAAS